MTRKKREARSRRQLARLGPIYVLSLDGEHVAALDPTVTDGEIRAVQQGRRRLKIVTLRVRRGQVI